MTRYWPALAVVGPLSGQELLPARELVPDAHAVHTLDPVAAA